MQQAPLPTPQSVQVHSVPLQPATSASRGGHWKAIEFFGWLLVFTVIPTAVGYLLGWLVGASRAPAVASLIPVLFGLMTAIGYYFIDRQVSNKKTLDEINSIEEVKAMPEFARTMLDRVINSNSPPIWFPYIWTAGVVMCCLAIYDGVLDGIAYRIRKPPSVLELVGSAEGSSTQPIALTPYEHAVLERVRSGMHARYASKEEIKQVIHHALLPTITIHREETKSTRVAVEKFTADVDQLLSEPPPPSPPAPAAPTKATSNAFSTALVNQVEPPAHISPPPAPDYQSRMQELQSRGEKLLERMETPVPDRAVDPEFLKELKVYIVRALSKYESKRVTESETLLKMHAEIVLGEKLEEAPEPTSAGDGGAAPAAAPAVEAAPK